MLPLIQKYLDGKSSVEEERELLDWIQASEVNRKAFKDHVKLWNYTHKEEYAFDADRAFETITEKTGTIPPKKQRFFNSIYKYAAVLVIGLLSFYFYTYITDTPGSREGPKEGKKSNDIVLIANNGTQEIIPEQEEELSYLSPAERNVEEDTAYHTILVPRGRVFSLVLSDSTKIRLNAETRIRYPGKFLPTEETRTVYIEGEAFFEVAHNKEQPFIVKSGGLEIEVLGTKFNVSSYASNAAINTTLVDGSVKVSSPGEQAPPVVLRPSQQATYDKKTTLMEVFDVDTGMYTAWTDKRIVFDNEPFRDIILKIERIYDVDIVNKLPDTGQEHFTGEFGREDSIKDILKIIGSSIDFKYKTENEKIILY
ncbi:FecR family protein [Sinomicrobium sp. M5D2P17]